MINAGIVEYGAFIAAISEFNLSSLTSIAPSMDVFLMVGGFIIFFWLVVFKL